MRYTKFMLLVGCAVGLANGTAKAQVPVIDSATLSQATQTATNTSDIMKTNQNILSTVQQTYAALTGNRDTNAIASAALGTGFQMGGAPDLSSILGGSSMNWGNLGQYGSVAAKIINGINLVSSLTGQTGNQMTGVDKTYLGAANTAAALTGMISGAQSAASARSSALSAVGQQIGKAPDLKASIDQNSQIGVQNALTVNELIGSVNGTNAALNAQAMQELAATAKAAQVMQFDANSMVMVGGQ